MPDEKERKQLDFNRYVSFVFQFERLTGPLPAFKIKVFEWGHIFFGGIVMRASLRAPLLSLGCFAFLVLAGSGRLAAADDIESKRVHFTTFDEVELSGTFYRSNPVGKRPKDAVVLLLHDFRGPKGGDSKEDGWIRLAGQLQKEGYSVLSFDFRGFGKSTSVNPQFWMHPHNRFLRGARAAKPPASIDQKTFRADYYPYLVNDIAAARAYLNTMNDSGQVNASNIIVIGAGQGATLGALWMASECKRQRDPNSDRLLVGENPVWTPLSKFDDPEGNDLAAAVWLTISPTLERRTVRPLNAALQDIAKNAKIPTYFLYGKGDQAATNLTKYQMKTISDQKGVKEKGLPGVGDLAGSKLLKKDTIDYITEYLNRVIEDRGTRVRKDRQDQKYAFCWTLPWPTAVRVNRIIAKMPGDAVPRIIPGNILGFR